MSENKDKSKQRMWKENWRWSGWKSSDYRRRITNAKPWEIVHHRDENKENNSKDNFKVLKPKNWMTATWVHNSEEHKDKAVKWWKARWKK